MPGATQAPGTGGCDANTVTAQDLGPADLRTLILSADRQLAEIAVGLSSEVLSDARRRDPDGGTDCAEVPIACRSRAPTSAVTGRGLPAQLTLLPPFVRSPHVATPSHRRREGGTARVRQTSRIAWADSQARRAAEPREAKPGHHSGTALAATDVDAALAASDAALQHRGGSTDRAWHDLTAYRDTLAARHTAAVCRLMYG